MRSIAIGLLIVAAAPMGAIGTAMAQVPTCYDRTCKKEGGDRIYRGAENSVGMTIDSDFETKVNVAMLSIEEVDVRIPKPPYGVTGSGTCLIKFNLSEIGYATDVVISRCPDAYAIAIKESSTEWRYRPVLDKKGKPRSIKRASMMLPWESWQVSVSD